MQYSFLFTLGVWSFSLVSVNQRAICDQGHSHMGAIISRSLPKVHYCIGSAYNNSCDITNSPISEELPGHALENRFILKPACKIGINTGSVKAQPIPPALLHASHLPHLNNPCCATSKHQAPPGGAAEEPCSPQIGSIVPSCNCMTKFPHDGGGSLKRQ